MTTTDLILSRNDLILEPRRREPTIAGPIRTGALVIALAFGGSLSWGLLASLDSAAHGAGTVVVDGNRKTVQHLEGGIVAELRVHDGDLVKAGQVLLRLEGTQSHSSLEEMTAEHAAARVKVARLRAEAADERSFALPDDLVPVADTPATQRALAVQRQLFAARWTNYDADITVLREQRRQAEREVAAYRAEERAASEQIVFIEEELAGVQELVNKGLERKTRVLSLKRAMAELAGNRDQGHARAAQSEQAVAVAEFQLHSRETKRLSEIAADLEEAQRTLDQVQSRIVNARDLVARTEIRAPVDGRVVSQSMFTLGGVVKPGEAILEIVPEHERMTIEARIDPQDIDVVHAGQTAQVHLSAYKARRTPAIDATVVDVSADRLTDPKTNAPYFVARVAPVPGALDKLDHVELHPGMPADVLIATGKRRAIDYFLAPLEDAMAHALIED